MRFANLRRLESPLILRRARGRTAWKRWTFESAAEDR